MNKSLAIGQLVIKELYRRKDFYVLIVLTALITGLLGTVTFFNDAKIVRHLKEICLLLIWISSLVICVTTTARQIPAEKENRTIFPLLAKPVTRWQVVFGKFLGCWFACGIALVMFYLFFDLVSELRGRDSAAPPAATEQSTNTVAPPQAQPAQAEAKHDEHAGHDHAAHAGEDHDQDEHEEHAASSPWINYLQAVWLHWVMLGVVTAIVLFGSVLFSAPSANTTICFIGVLGILFLGEHLHKVALRLSEPSQTILSAIYFIIPHLEWYDIRDHIIYDHPPIAWGPCGLATLYAAAYAGLFLLLAWLSFRRKGLTT